MSRQQWGHGYASGVKAGIKARTSFYDYVRILYDGEDSPEGDFAFDIQRDSDFPKKAWQEIDPNTHRQFSYYGTVLAYIDGYKYGCDVSRAIEVFNDLFHEWLLVTGNLMKPELWEIDSDEWDYDAEGWVKLYVYGDEWELYQLTNRNIEGYYTPEEAKEAWLKQEASSNAETKTTITSAGGDD